MTKDLEQATRSADASLPRPASAATPLAALEAARVVLSDRKRWTKGELARDADGSRCRESQPYAVRWCAIGAIARVSADLTIECAARDILKAVMPGGSIAEFNDAKRRTHKQILARFDKAIAKARAALTTTEA